VRIAEEVGFQMGTRVEVCQINDILLEKRLSYVTEIRYTMLYGKSQMI
jgi:hypothetical protein